MVFHRNDFVDESPTLFCGLHCRNIQGIYMLFHCNEFVHVQSIVSLMVQNTNIENIDRTFLRCESFYDKISVILTWRCRNIECIRIF